VFLTFDDLLAELGFVRRIALLNGQFRGDGDLGGRRLPARAARSRSA